MARRSILRAAQDGLEDFEPVKQEIKETKRLKRKLKRKKSSVETV